MERKCLLADRSVEGSATEAVVHLRAKMRANLSSVWNRAVQDRRAAFSPKLQPHSVSASPKRDLIVPAEAQLFTE